MADLPNERKYVNGHPIDAYQSPKTLENTKTFLARVVPKNSGHEKQIEVSVAEDSVKFMAWLKKLFEMEERDPAHIVWVRQRGTDNILIGFDQSFRTTLKNMADIKPEKFEDLPQILLAVGDQSAYRDYEKGLDSEDMIPYFITTHTGESFFELARE